MTYISCEVDEMTFLYQNGCIIDEVCGYRVIYSGIVIYKSYSVGKESVVVFFTDYLKGKACVEDLFGFFWIVAENSEQSFFICDNSGMMPLYYSIGDTVVVSDSLIDLAEYLKLSHEDFDKISLISFLEFGFCFSGTTFFNFIKRCSGKIIYHIDIDGVLQQEEKNIKAINDRFDEKKFAERIISILKAFSTQSDIQDIPSSYSKETLVLDCTGGADSRLVIALAQKAKLNFQLFVRGHKDCADIVVAKKIAQLLEKELTICEAKPITDFSLDNLCSLWKKMDGIGSLFDGSQFLDAYKMKKKLGFSYSLGGFAGGEYFRNYVILRRGKKGDLARDLCNFCRTKIQGVNKTDYEEYESMLNSVIRQNSNSKSKMMANVDLYRHEIFPYRSGSIYSVAARICPSYGPLGENLLAEWAQQLPFYKKWYSLVFRKIISNENTQLANLKTIYNNNLSLSIISLLHDASYDLIVFLKRIYSKIFAKKMYKPNSYYVSATTDCSELKKSIVYEQMIQYICELQIFDEFEYLQTIPDIVLDRLITLYLWGVFFQTKK